MNSIALMARESHSAALQHVALAGHFRGQRDEAIRRLYETGEYSYTMIAEQVGCTKQLIAKICQRAVPCSKHDP